MRLFPLSLLAAVLACAPLTWAEPAQQGTTVVQLAHQAPVHWVSVDQIATSLAGQPPMAVGFDIDDTLLFSSPGLYRGKREFSPHDA